MDGGVGRGNGDGRWWYPQGWNKSTVDWLAIDFKDAPIIVAQQIGKESFFIERRVGIILLHSLSKIRLLSYLGTFL